MPDFIIFKAYGLSNLHEVFLLEVKTFSGDKTGAFFLSGNLIISVSRQNNNAVDEFRSIFSLF